MDNYLYCQNQIATCTVSVGSSEVWSQFVSLMFYWKRRHQSSIHFGWSWFKGSFILLSNGFRTYCQRVQTLGKVYQHIEPVSPKKKEKNSPQEKGILDTTTCFLATVIEQTRRGDVSGIDISGKSKLRVKQLKSQEIRCGLSWRKVEDDIHDLEAYKSNLCSCFDPQGHWSPFNRYQWSQGVIKTNKRNGILLGIVVRYSTWQELVEETIISSRTSQDVTGLFWPTGGRNNNSEESSTTNMSVWSSYLLAGNSDSGKSSSGHRNSICWRRHVNMGC